MMEPIDLSTRTALVLALTFGLSAVFGGIAHRTHFCTMGAISDVVVMGDWTRVRQWALALSVAILGFGLLSGFGLIHPDDALYASQRWSWLSSLCGGGMFGFGMVLASGCGNKTLVRIGGGNLKALVVFVVMAIAAFATLKGLTAVWRTNTVDRVHYDFNSILTLPHIGSKLLGQTFTSVAVGMSVILSLLLAGWVFASKDFWQWKNLVAGLGLGGVIVAMWWVSGALGYMPEHPMTLEPTYLATNSGRMEALTFTAPMAYAIDWLMFYSDANKRLTLAVVAVAGVVSGAAVDALATRQFRWEGFRTTGDLGNHLVGAVLMGVGGVTAMGCTVGHGLSGLSVLSLNSVTAIAAIVAGAWLALRIQLWRLERAA